ncbi:hypothetical protein CHS0354_027887 [Potamilus streckersoni]|uniref:Uncharacterized protein n=1 Tax=Potamilus streckersoni TaxID=2493646 RepID=A0AAE0W5S0_9BIVA|nr:hypothetical protein CHS0354_027887 [Potamilus streckersoni]
MDGTKNKEDRGPVRISDSNVAVEMNNMTAFWDSHQHSQQSSDKEQNDHAGIALMGEDLHFTSFGLKNISLQVRKGELLAVIGPVGSGKSSFLMSLLGELPPLEGGVTLNGCLGYVSQQPWVFSGTLRENILFGSPYDKSKYDQIVQCCALIKDIEQLRYGDLTLVGERGLCLSGGQKARVTLARCICDYLKEKTRILVTHQLQYLKKADRILILKEGVIGDIGTFDELSARGIEFHDLLEDPDHKERDSHDSDVKEDLIESDGQIKAEESEQCVEEDQSEGRVGISIYRQYLASCSGYITVPAILLIGFTVHGAYIAADWCLARWAEFHELQTFSDLSSLSTSSNRENCSTIPGPLNTSSLVSLIFPMTVMPNITMPNQNGSLHLSQESGSLSDYYMTLYTVLSTSYLGLVFILTAIFYSFATLASKRLHDKMFWIVLGAKSRFFDSNPVGRILNRFSRDIGFIDEILPRIFFVVVELTIRLIGLILTTCIINPWLLIPVLIMTVFIVVLRYYAMHTLRETKRIEAIARSPMYSHVSDTLVGIHTIRALGKRDQFIHEFDTLQNTHTSAWFIFLSSYRWFSLRSLFAVYIYFNIVIHISIIVKHGFGLTSGLLGLSINYCLIIADPFEFLVRMTAELENAMTSVERVLSYTSLEQEAAKDSPHPPHADWPQSGEITLNNLSLSYTSDGAQVLKNISCSIKSKEKIGIVGRTGAGKSSLMVAILRMAEPSGDLIIDNINVLKIGLHELRKKISVIPQDPVLFSGTLRRNLDPFDEYTDDQLWKVLSQVQLSDKVSNSQGGLSMEVSEGGQNFSVGQRQLLCLARAMLRFNKILILDEATANVDHMTDELIQQTVRDHFRHCTVLTIAHRLRTVMDSDRLMVLEHGQLVEMDRPDVLLQNPEGYFYKLVQQTGNSEAHKLHALAGKERKENRRC